MPAISTFSRRIFSSTVWSLLGTVVPMFAALLAVPWLMRHLGQERLGVLSLVWVVVGYFSFLDMGLGRAVTVAVASLRSDGENVSDQEMHVLGSAAVLLVSIGVAMGVLLGLGVVRWGVPFNLSSFALQDEVRLALLVTLPGLPMLLLSSVFRGHLEGVGAFRTLNMLRIPTGILLVVGPCLTAYVSPSLIWACAAILVVRSVHLLVLWIFVAQETGYAKMAFIKALMGSVTRPWLRRLLSFGGWVTLSNVVGPVIVYVDRFVIGAILTASSVAAYSVPFDMVSRLPILVAALCSVLLPELARLAGLARTTDSNAAILAHQLVKKSSAVSFVIVSILVWTGWAITPWALGTWLGSDFAMQSTEITQILLIAFGINALAQIPFTALQANGRVRAVALLHAAELLPFALLVYFSIGRYGLVGAAWACLIRGLADYLFLTWLWWRQALRLSIVIKF